MLLFTSLFPGGSLGGPGLPGEHRYWRVYVTSNQSLDQTAILELEMYASELGENLCSGGTASADSVFGDYAASRGFDGELRDLPGGTSDDRLWASANTAPPHWLVYDFGAGNEVQVLAVGLCARQPAFVGQTPDDFEVQHSDDGVAWTTAWSVVNAGLSAFEFRRFVHPGAGAAHYTGSPHGAHACWRFFSMRADSDDAVALAEMEFRAVPGGADQATGGTPSASSVWTASNPDLFASNAFDDNPATIWSAENNSNYAWLQYQFASPVEVSEVEITARSDLAANTSPGEFAFQHSDDGVAWTTAWTGLGETGWTLGEARVYTDPSYVSPVPDLDAFAWVNQGAATATQQADGIFLLDPAHTDRQARALVRSMPATPYTITTRWASSSFLHEPITIGLLFRDSTSGRMHMGALRYENAAFELLTTRYADPQTKDGDDTPVKNIAEWMEPWLRIEDDGTNLRFLYSADGDNWILVNEQLRTAWLADPDQVGIYFQGRNFVSATDDLVAKIFLWEVT